MTKLYQKYESLGHQEVRPWRRLRSPALQHAARSRCASIGTQGLERVHQPGPRARHILHSREVPVTLSDNGEIVEGIADLAFEEPEGWTVIDFKTDAEIAGRLDMYKRQVNLYALAISKATNRKTTAFLMQL